MELILNHLDKILISAAIGQLMVAVLNMRLDKILKWDSELMNIDRLLYEVFYVHKWFISITMAFFGIITLRFAGDIGNAEYEMTRWFAAGVGIFWAIRTAIQWTFYSTEHWKGDTGRTIIHWILTICYGGCTATYLTAAFQ